MLLEIFVEWLATVLLVVVLVSSLVEGFSALVIEGLSTMTAMIASLVIVPVLLSALMSTLVTALVLTTLLIMLVVWFVLIVVLLGLALVLWLSSLGFYFVWGGLFIFFILIFIIISFSILIILIIVFKIIKIFVIKSFQILIIVIKIAVVFFGRCSCRFLNRGLSLSDGLSSWSWFSLGGCWLLHRRLGFLSCRGHCFRLCKLFFF